MRLAVPRQQLAAPEISACSPAADPYEIATDARTHACLRYGVVARFGRPSTTCPHYFLECNSHRGVAATVTVASPGAIHSSAFTRRRDVRAVPTPSSPEQTHASASKTLASRQKSHTPAIQTHGLRGRTGLPRRRTNCGETERRQSAAAIAHESHIYKYKNFFGEVTRTTP